MGKAIGIIAIKGGVGKTTIAASLAADLAHHYKQKVLLVDANYSAPNLGLHMDIITPDKTIHDVLRGTARAARAVHRRHGVDVIPGSYAQTREINLLRLKDKLSSMKRMYDFVIIDGSPSLHDEVLSTILASDMLFVVSTPDYPTLSCSLSAARLAKQRGKPIAGIIINKIRDPAHELTLKEIQDVTQIPVVARIPDEAIHSRALFRRVPSVLDSPRSVFAREIRALNATFMGVREKRGLFRRLFPVHERAEVVNRQILKHGFYTNTFVPLSSTSNAHEIELPPIDIEEIAVHEK